MISSSAVSQCLPSALLSCHIELLTLLLPQSAAWYRCNPWTGMSPSPCRFDEDKAKGCILAESPPCPLQQREKRTPANAVSLCPDLGAVNGHVFVSLTVWPWGCSCVRRLRAVPPGLSSPGSPALGSRLLPGSQHAAGGAPCPPRRPGDGVFV